MIVWLNISLAKSMKNFLREYPKTTFREFTEKIKIYTIWNIIPENERINIFYKHRIQVLQKNTENFIKDLYKKNYKEIKMQLQRDYDKTRKIASKLLREKEDHRANKYFEKSRRSN